MSKEDKGLDHDTTAFSKVIPARVLLTPDRLDAILRGDKANLLLTTIQRGILQADRPLLIHGQAGSGKTLVLCNRLALSISQREQPLSKLVFLTYNDRLVQQAEKYTEEILKLQLGYNGSLGSVYFEPLQAFMKERVPLSNSARFTPEKYVPYGRFKAFYEMYRRGNAVAKKISCEVAWHGIRSILKGSCIPPSVPPLSSQEYDQLAKKRQDFTDDMFDDIYSLGNWYQNEVIKKNQFWDDQDLAWTALKWILNMQENNEPMQLYDEIFCDEGQDLTEIEFRVLVSLCKHPRIGATEGLPLVFAGDPLQTINPTGFRWSVIKNQVYNVQGRSVALYYLKENFRSDQKIVKFANYIQATRSRFLEQPVEEQQGFEKDGDIPWIIKLETKDEVTLIREKLGELNQIADVAVIVWAEGDDEIEQYCKHDDALGKIDRAIIYSVSEAKGLEFRLVVLYKFGSSDDMIKWKDYLCQNRALPPKDEIPVLYFLNKLYVAATRAKSFLILIDTPEGVENLLSVWKKAEQERNLSVWPRSEIREFFGTHPAFRGDSSEDAWRQWAEELFDHAEMTRDLRQYERARRAYEKAGETQNVKKVNARIFEIEEKWNDAGKLYFDLNKDAEARACYDRAENWDGALKATERLPTTPETKRYLSIYRFKIYRKQNEAKAAEEFYKFYLTDKTLDRTTLEELGTALLRSGDSLHATEIFLDIGNKFGDKAVLVKVADSLFGKGDFESAEKLYEAAGETKSRNYQLSRAENLLKKGDYPEAAKIFHENELFEKVLTISQQFEHEKGNSPKGQLLELTADSNFKLKRYSRAVSLYRLLLTEIGRSQDARILGRIGECLEMLGDKLGAYQSYRDAKLYEKATDLAPELGIPDQEITSLRIYAAMENNDFEKANLLARNSADEKTVHIAAGKYYLSKKDFVKAASELMKAELWRETVDSILQAETQASGQYGEEFNQSYEFLAAIARTKDPIDPDIKYQIMRIATQVQDDPSCWSHINPQEMGKVYEKCARFEEAAIYYRSRQETWAKEGWMRVKNAQVDFFKKRKEFDKAAQIEKEIFQARLAQGSVTLTDEFNREQTEILRETDKIKNKELSTREKHDQYVEIIATYLQIHVPKNLKLVKPPFITDLPTQFTLLLVKQQSVLSSQNNGLLYRLEDIVTAVEIRGHGWVEKADELEDAIKQKKASFDEIKANKGITCLYLTLEERRKPKEGMETSYHSLSKKYLASNYFSLRDSSTRIENPHEWENFVKMAVSQQ